jgi:hypothetical protein
MTIQAIKVTNLKSESANSNFGTPHPLKALYSDSRPLFRPPGFSSGSPASLQAPRHLFRLLSLSPGTPASLQAPWLLFRLLSLTLQASRHLPRHLPAAFAPSICQICQLTPASVEHLIYPNICIPEKYHKYLSNISTCIWHPQNIHPASIWHPPDIHLTST